MKKSILNVLDTVIAAALVIASVVAIVALLSGCGDNIPVVIDIDTAPDAGVPDVDAMHDAMHDAPNCVAPPDAGAEDCCRFAPDTAAIGECAAPTFPPGTCGVVACKQADCSFIKVNVCGAP